MLAPTSSFSEFASAPARSKSNMFMFAVLAVCMIAPLTVVSSEARGCTQYQTLLFNNIFRSPRVTNDMWACAAVSGWSPVPGDTAPTVEQQTLMCFEPSCINMIAAIAASNPPDCVMRYTHADPTLDMNPKNLVDGFKPFCDKVMQSNGSSSSSGEVAPAMGDASLV